MAMSKSLKIAFNPVVAKIIDGDESAHEFVSDLLSYVVEGHEFSQSFQSGTWTGRSTFFTHLNKTFPAGFVHLVQSELAKRGYHVMLIAKKVEPALGPELPIVDAFGNDDPRYDFQVKALRAVRRHHRGIIQVATGGGKSKIAKLVLAHYRRMSLFLTTRGVLMHQMRTDLQRSGMKVGVLGDGEWSPVNGINVGMVQTLQSRLNEIPIDAIQSDILAQNARAIALAKKAKKEPPAEITRREAHALAEVKFKKRAIIRAKTIKMLEMFHVVIGEEAHESSGNAYYDILRHCKNAQIRVALTATPFMRADAEENMRLMAAFGPILIRVSEKVLIDRGILAKPYFRFMNVEPHPKMYKMSPWPRAYKLGIIEGQHRNAAIVAYAKKAARYKLPTLILVQRMAHGDFLLQELRKHIRAAFIRGENNQAERHEALANLGAGKLDVVIGTNILDVGVDVPAVGMIILAGAGKAEVAMRQRIGRGLRAKKNGPNVAFVLDFNDVKNTHLRAHSRQRRAIVESTPGFAENVISDDSDFDWSIFKT